MSHRQIVALVALLVFTPILGCGKQNEGKPQTLTKVSLRQEWFPNANYCGAVFAMREFAAPNGIEIEIRPGSDTVDPVKTVISGEDDFADAAADRVLDANAKGADLVVVGVVNLESPVCFLTRAKDNIVAPRDFQGRRVGILTGTTTEYVYRALLRRQGVDESQVHEVEVPFDLGTFIAGAYDVRPAFIYDEPVSMDAAGIEYEILEPRHYGLHFLGTVYFTRGKLVRDRPALVQQFVTAVADGWRAAIKYPDRAVTMLHDYDPTIDVVRERRSLEMSLPYVSGRNGRPLDAELSDWYGTVGSLKALGLIDSIDVRTMYNDRFIKQYYDKLADGEQR